MYRITSEDDKKFIVKSYKKTVKKAKINIHFVHINDIKQACNKTTHLDFLNIIPICKNFDFTHFTIKADDFTYVKQYIITNTFENNRLNDANDETLKIYINILNLTDYCKLGLSSTQYELYKQLIGDETNEKSEIYYDLLHYEIKTIKEKTQIKLINLCEFQKNILQKITFTTERKHSIDHDLEYLLTSTPLCQNFKMKKNSSFFGYHNTCEFDHMIDGYKFKQNDDLRSCANMTGACTICTIGVSLKQYEIYQTLIQQ